MDTIQKSRVFAKKKHDDTGVTRKFSRQPYFVHPESTYKIANAYGLNDYQLQAAYLHDTLEDTNTDIQELEDQFGPVVAELVSELTSDKDAIKAVGKENYMNDHLVTMSSDALDVKLCDMLYNCLDFPGEEQKNRILRNISYLMKHRKLTDIQEELCYSILCENTILSAAKLKEMTAAQLRGNVSGITMKHWEIRQGERNAIGCLDAIWTNNIAKDTLLIKLASSATFTRGKDYIEEVLFNKPKKYLQKYFDATVWKDKKAALLELFKNCDIKVHSSSPDFFYQGAWEDLYSKNLAIYKFKGPKGKGVWRQRHADSGGLTDAKVRITKHLFDVLNSITNGSDDFYKHVMMLLDNLPNKPKKVSKDKKVAAEVNNTSEENAETMTDE